jgi:hypothetical protein
MCIYITISPYASITYLASYHTLYLHANYCGMDFGSINILSWSDTPQNFARLLSTAFVKLSLATTERTTVLTVLCVRVCVWEGGGIHLNQTGRCHNNIYLIDS